MALSDSTYGARGVAEWLAQQGAPLEDVAYSSAAISEPIPGNLWTVYR